MHENCPSEERLCLHSLCDSEKIQEKKNLIPIHKKNSLLSYENVFAFNEKEG